MAKFQFRQYAGGVERDSFDMTQAFEEGYWKKSIARDKSQAFIWFFLPKDKNEKRNC